MSRTSARRHAFKLIFMFEFLHSDISNMFDIYVSDFLHEFDEYEKGNWDNIKNLSDYCFEDLGTAKNFFDQNRFIIN